MLTSARLILRPVRLEDAAEFARLLGNDREAVFMMARVPWPCTEEAVRDWIEMPIQPGEHVFAVTRREDGAVLGAIGFAGEPAEPEVGYWIGRPYWNRGYASEALRLVMAHAGSLGAVGLRAETFPGNVASERALEKCGFARLGKARRDLPARGGLRDVWVWACDLRAGSEHERSDGEREETGGVPTDWAGLWRKLASRDLTAGAEGEAGMVERWRRMARQLDSGERRDPDPLLDFILGRLTPEMEVLDVGAGIGRWTLPIARHARRVTALEPLAGMREVLAERLARAGMTHVGIVSAPWMEAEVAPHDVVIAAHATYTTTDLAAFVRKMEACARRSVYLALRIPAHDGVMGALCRQIWGRWHDSPNFIVGYNLLLGAGFYPNVLVEPRAVRRWTDPTLDAALARAKRHLRLDTEAHDAEICEVLARRLVVADGTYCWPDGMRSALLWWETS